MLNNSNNNNNNNNGHRTHTNSANLEEMSLMRNATLLISFWNETNTIRADYLYSFMFVCWALIAGINSSNEACYFTPEIKLKLETEPISFGNGNTSSILHLLSALCLTSLLQNIQKTSGKVWNTVLFCSVHL